MPSASPKRAKKSSSRTSSPRKTSPRSTGGVSLSSTNLMRSMSPSASTRTATKRKIACTEGRDGKLKCITVDTNQMPVSDAAKAIIAKKVDACQKLEDQGFGACDAEGNFWGYQDEMPQGYHEEIDENGNIVRSVILEPKNILVLPKGAESTLKNIKSMMDGGENYVSLNNFLAMFQPDVKKSELIKFYDNNSISGSKSFRNFINDSELKLVNPDKLKTVFMITKEEVVNRNKLMRYLVCLAADDEEGANATRFGYVGSNVANLAKNILKYRFIAKVFEFVSKDNVKSALKDRNITAQMRELNISSDMSLIQGDDLIFERIRWNYDGLRSVSVKIPETLAAKIGEKLAFNELNNLIDEYNSGDPIDRDRFKNWLKRLIQNGNVLGSELSGTLVASLIIQGGFEPGDLGLTEEYCIPILNASRESKTMLLSSGKNEKVSSVYTKSDYARPLLKEFVFGKNVAPMSRKDTAEAAVKRAQQAAAEAAAEAAEVAEKAGEAETIDRIKKELEEAKKGSNQEKVRLLEARLKAVEKDIAVRAAQRAARRAVFLAQIEAQQAMNEAVDAEATQAAEQAAKEAEARGALPDQVAEVREAAAREVRDRAARAAREAAAREAAVREVAAREAATRAAREAGEAGVAGVAEGGISSFTGRGEVQNEFR